jgi:hypothetical protein
MFDKLIVLYPKLTVEDFHPTRGTILLQNDGRGDYIAAWNHPTLPRPTEEQLA